MADWFLVGGGSWALGSNWALGAAPNAIGASAYFPYYDSGSTGSRTVTLGNGTFTVGSLSFVASSTHFYALATGTLIMQVASGAASITVTGVGGSTTLGSDLALELASNASLSAISGVPFEIDGIVSGPGSLTLTGAGPVTMTGANTYSGGTQINAGVLHIGNGGTTGSIAGDIVDNATLTFDHSDTITVGNTISGTGNLVKNGSALLYLTGTNFYTGTTTVNDGALVVGAGGASGTLGDGTGAVIVNAGAALDLNRSDIFTYSNAISGGGIVRLFQSSTTILTGANTYIGGTQINAGILIVGDGGTKGSIASDVTDNATLAFDRSDSITYAGHVSGAGGLVQAGTGTTILTGANIYTGATAIYAGTLQIGDGGGTGGLASATAINIGSGATLAIDNPQSGTIGNLISGAGALHLMQIGITNSYVLTNGANSFSGGTTIDNGANVIISGSSAAGALGAGPVVNNAVIYFNIGSGAGDLTFANAISGSGLVSARANTVTLTGANTYTGLTSLNGGTLKAGAALTFSADSDVAFHDGSSVLDLGGFDQRIGALSGTGGTIQNLTANTSAGLIENNATDTTFDGQIIDAPTSNATLGLIKTGAGKLTLTGANTYSGSTILDQGALALAGSSTLENSTVRMAAGTIFDISGTTNDRVSIRDLLGNTGNLFGAVVFGGKTLLLSTAQDSETEHFVGTVGKSDILAISVASTNFTLGAGAVFVDWTDGEDKIGILGNAQANSLTGSAQADTFVGGGRNDAIDGGAGFDVAGYSGLAADYTITRNADRTIAIADNRTGSPDGTDMLTSIESLQFFDKTVSLASAAYDFNADTRADILFRNGSGVTYLWTMNGASVTSGATTSTQVGTNWQIRGVGDFNGDGAADILWAYNNAANASDPLNGVSYVSFQNGPSASGGGVVQQLSSVWQIAGTGDFNGDGMADVLYRNTSSGQTYLDIMNGSSVNGGSSGFTSQQVTNLNWKVAAVADFSGDGNADVLWRYNNNSNAADPLNGVLYEWQMNGTGVASAGLLSQQAGKNWQVAGSGDFNGDGKADILFRYENTANAADTLNGFTYIDFMNGTNVTSGAPTQWQIDNSWAIASIGEYNADGMSDILLQQASTGNTYIWTMNGANVISGAFTSQQSGSGWNVQNGVLIG